MRKWTSKQFSLMSQTKEKFILQFMDTISNSLIYQFANIFYLLQFSLRNNWEKLVNDATIHVFSSSENNRFLQSRMFFFIGLGFGREPVTNQTQIVIGFFNYTIKKQTNKTKWKRNYSCQSQYKCRNGGVLNIAFYYWY